MREGLKEEDRRTVSSGRRLKGKEKKMPQVTPHSVLSHGVIAIKDVIEKINETWMWTVLYIMEFSDARLSDFDNTYAKEYPYFHDVHTKIFRGEGTWCL